MAPPHILFQIGPQTRASIGRYSPHSTASSAAFAMAALSAAALLALLSVADAARAGAFLPSRARWPFTCRSATCRRAAHAASAAPERRFAAVPAQLAGRCSAAASPLHAGGRCQHASTRPDACPHLLCTQAPSWCALYTLLPREQRRSAEHAARAPTSLQLVARVIAAAAPRRFTARRESPPSAPIGCKRPVRAAPHAGWRLVAVHWARVIMRCASHAARPPHAAGPFAAADEPGVPGDEDGRASPAPRVQAAQQESHARCAPVVTCPLSSQNSVLTHGGAAGIIIGLCLFPFMCICLIWAFVRSHQ